VLVAGSLAPPSYGARTDRLAGLPAVPEGVASITDLTCPSPTLCVGVSSPSSGDQAVAVGTGDRTTWSLSELPHPAGTDVLVVGLRCPTAGLCLAWGSAGAATVWVTTSPAAGGWQRQVLGSYPNPGQVNDVDCGATLCVAVSDSWVNGEPLGGSAWVSTDLLGGSWSSSPLDAVYRIFQLSCVDAMCVAEGQAKPEFNVTAALWSTSDALTGTWTRTEPSAYPYDVDGLSAIHCLTASLCIVNAVVATADGAFIYAKRGYFTSTVPTTGVWDWHQIPPYYLGIGPLFCAQVGECLMYDGNNVWADPDPTDEDVQPVSVPIEHQNYLALRGFSCFDASTCQVWGSDSGAATAGPLMATRVWRGPASGAGAWSAAALPPPAGHSGEVPVAGDLACSGLTCTAVGVLSSASYPYQVTLAPIVWTAGADGVWHVVAAGSDDTGGGGGGGGSGVTKVTTAVSRLGVQRKENGPRLVGKLASKQGCARERIVKVIDRHGRTATKLTTNRRGRFKVHLTHALLQRIGPKVWVKVPKRKRGAALVCLGTRSAKVPTRPRAGP
jgi:hypothetical protein